MQTHERDQIIDTINELRQNREAIARNQTLRDRVKQFLGRGEPTSVATVDMDVAALEDQLKALDRQDEREHTRARDEANARRDAEAIRPKLAAAVEHLSVLLGESEDIARRVAKVASVSAGNGHVLMTGGLRGPWGFVLNPRPLRQQLERWIRLNADAKVGSV